MLCCKNKISPTLLCTVYFVICTTVHPKMIVCSHLKIVIMYSKIRFCSNPTIYAKEITSILIESGVLSRNKR